MFVKINTYKDSYKFGDVARQRPPIAVINITPRVVVLPSNSSSHSPGFAEIFLQLLSLAPGGNIIELSAGRQSLLSGDKVEIDECIAYADALRAEGIDARVVVEAVAREEVKTSTRGSVKVRVERVTHLAVPDDIPKPAQEEGAIEGTYETLGELVQRFHDHTVEIPVHRVQVTEGIQRDQGHRIIAIGQQSVILSERISKLERDNTRLRDTLDVTRQRVSRLQLRELRVRREMRQIRHF
ncbi:hypothetical protein Tco_0735322 [Tanacetum coccineum]